VTRGNFFLCGKDDSDGKNFTGWEIFKKLQINTMRKEVRGQEREEKNTGDGAGDPVEMSP
jgi:hypothetical protein